MNMSSSAVDKCVSLSTQYAILSRPYTDDQVEWYYLALSYMTRMIILVSILAVLVIVLTLLIRYLADCGNDASTSLEQGTTRQLLPKNAIPFTYGTCDEDLESGIKSCRLASSSDDLYDGKLCIICYDEQRNCFFVPCGHCATCHVCAQRIAEGESKTCPVCRRFIRRVKKLFNSQNQTSE